MGRILPIELKEFAATALTGSPQNFGTPLSNPAIKISVFNTSNVDVYLGAVTPAYTMKLRIPGGSALTLDESTLYFRGVDQEYYLQRTAQLTLTQVTGAGASGNIIAHIVTRELP